MTALKKKWGMRLCVLALILTAATTPAGASDQKDWAATLYAGRLTDESLGRMVTRGFDFEDAYYVGLGMMRRIYTYRHYFDLELEGQVDKFWGDQDNWEFVFLGYFRWLAFPWDRYLDTSFAAGAGLSYATSVPEIEVKNQGESAKFLGALAFEFTFSLPSAPQWSLVTAIHHRSGAGGLINDMHGASNGLGVGIRYWF